MSTIKIRPPTSNVLADIVIMLYFLIKKYQIKFQELADFEKMSEGPQLTVEDLLRDGNFDGKSPIPLYYSFVTEKESTKKLVTYSI